jgi:hypothetical protein
MDSSAVGCRKAVSLADGWKHPGWTPCAARRLRIGTVLFVFLVVNATTSMVFFCGIIMVVHGFSESSRNGVSNSFNYLRRFMNGFTRDSMR